MSDNNTRMVYEKVEAMANAFGQGVESLQDIALQAQSIANTLADGALLGDTGTAFVSLIREQLCPSLTRLTEKFAEVQCDINQAVIDTRESDERAANEMGM